MPRSTLGGDDPYPNRPYAERIERAKKLEKEAIEDLEKGNFKKKLRKEKKSDGLLRKRKSKMLIISMIFRQGDSLLNSE